MGPPPGHPRRSRHRAACCNSSLPASLNCNRKRCRRSQNSTASSGSAGAGRCPAGWQGSGRAAWSFAISRWSAGREAHRLHRQALRSDSPAGFHRLRIGIKRFRYIVENFLPEQHAAWSDDLKHMQDVLGEIHDLDVLWPAAVHANVFPDDDARLRWQNKFIEERAQRIEAYRQKDDGQMNKDSLWQVWRSQLPDRKQTAIRRPASPASSGPRFSTPTSSIPGTSARLCAPAL